MNQKVMPSKHILALALLTAAALGSFAQPALAAGPMCAQLFARASKSQEDPRLRQLRVSGQSTYVFYDRLLRKRLVGKVNPLQQNQIDANEVGRAMAQLATQFPHFHEYFQIAGRPEIKLKEYIELRARAREQIAQILRDPRSNDVRLFAALEINRVMSLIHAKVKFPPPPVDAKEEQKKKDEETKKEEDKKEEDQKEEDEPPQWDKMPDTYDPKNKDISSKDGKKQKKHDMLRTTVNVEKNLLRQKVYDITGNGQWAAAPLMRPQRSANHRGAVVGHSQILVAGATTIDMPIQYGVMPVLGDFKGYSVKEVYPDEFQIQITDSSLKYIQVDLQQPGPMSFINGAREHEYKTKSTIQTNQWPRELMEYVNGLKAQNLSVLDTAAALEKYLAHDGDYLYYSKGDLVDDAKFAQMQTELEHLMKTYPKAAAFAHLKSFNCDGAAEVGTILLRDFFGIAARPIGGRTVGGYKEIKGQRYFVSQSGGPLHAWLEVWAGDRWVPFDMTPKKNDPQSPSSKTDLKQVEEKENEGKPKEQKEQKGKKQEKGDPSDADGKDSKDKKAGEGKPGDEKDGKEGGKDGGKDEKKDGKAGEENKDGKEGKDGKDGKEGKEDKDGEHGEVRDINDRLNIRNGGGNQKMTSKAVDTPIAALYQAISNYGKERVLTLADRRSAVDQLQTWADSARDKSLAASVERAADETRRMFLEQFTTVPKSALSELMPAVQRKLINNDLTGAFADLRAIRAGINEVTRHRELNNIEVQFASRIDDFMSKVRTHRHADSKLFEIVERIVKQLPGKVSREWLRAKYGEGYMTLGDPALHALAADLSQDKLRPLVRASFLSDYARLVLNAERIPNFKDQKTSMRKTVMQKTNDLVVARSPLEITRMLLAPRAGESLFQPLIEGRQFAVGENQAHRIPDPKNTIERKVSIVYYDISGSMDGAPMHTVDALLLAFVDRSLSEVDPFGRPLHEVIVVPFNSELLPATRIKTREDALAFIARKVALGTKADGGTDIQKAILNFYDLVASAHKESLGEKQLARVLKRANLVLFSDGGSEIDMARVEAARKQVPANVNLFMNFVAIGGVNAKLQELAQASAKNSAKSMYRELSTEAIQEVEAKASLHFDENAFASADKTPRELTATFTQLLQGTPSFISAASEDVVRSHLQRLNFSETAGANLRNPGLVTALATLAAEIKSLELPRSVRIDFMERLLNSYESMSGRKLNALTYTEKTALENLGTWAFTR